MKAANYEVLCNFPHSDSQVLDSHTTTDKVTVLYILNIMFQEI